MTRYAMAIDKTRCFGCRACAMACKVSNNLTRDVWWNTVSVQGGAYFDTSSGEYGDNTMVYYPKNCMHCANPACVAACPTGASQVRDDGIVFVDDTMCIGCDACIAACPYDVRTHIDDEPEYYTEHTIGDPSAQKHIGGTVEKCDFCRGRIDRGEAPACMELCPGRARYWGDIDDPDSDISKALEGRTIEVLKEEAGTEPQFFYFS